MLTPSKNHSAFGKTEILYAVFLAVTTGAFFGSLADLFTLSYPEKRFPYRAPFDEITLWTAPFGFLLTLVLFLVHLIKKTVSWKNKIAFLVMEVFLAGGLAVIAVFLWWLGIDMLHDLKRAVGLSHA